MSEPEPNTKPAWRRWGVRALKLAVVILVVVFVARTFTDAWSEFTARGLKIDPVIALASAMVLAVSQLPMAWFWRSSLLAIDHPAPFGGTTIAYIVGQIGKYVPGKAMVVVIRTERLIEACRREEETEDASPSAGVAAATVFYETLTHMAVGSLLSAVLAATVPLGESGWRVGLVTLSLGLAFACVTPTLPPIFSRLLQKVTRSKLAASRVHGLTYGVAMRGVLASTLSWCLIALGGWLAARSVGVPADLTPETGGSWLLAATLPVVAGFVSLLPAGVVVREALTLTVLSPLLGEGDALAATIAFRVIWVATEVLLCGSLLAIGSQGRGRNHASQ